MIYGKHLTSCSFSAAQGKHDQAKQSRSTRQKLPLNLEVCSPVFNGLAIADDTMRGMPGVHHSSYSLSEVMSTVRYGEVVYPLVLRSRSREERKRKENSCSLHVDTKHCTFCTLNLYKCCPFLFFVSVISMSERILKAQRFSMVFYPDVQVTAFPLFDTHKTSTSAELAKEKQTILICP